jgi:vacuolar-type H+-ATPase subunit I/STV1
MTNQKKYTELEFCYFVSKLAKKHFSYKEFFYNKKNEILQALVEGGELKLKGFHSVGSYTSGKQYGSEFFTNTRKFYADLYETNDGKWSFHSPRENGRGKGNLGCVENLNENSAINKLSKNKIKLMEKDARIAETIKEIKRKEKEKNQKQKQALKVLGEQMEKEGCFKHVVYGPYSDDYAKFEFKKTSSTTIQLTKILTDYTWARRYNKPTQNVGDIINLLYEI